MSSLSPEPYKGTRDWYPSDMYLRNYIFSTWKKVVRRYGYEQYDAPLLEPLDVYAAKSGQEIVNDQTYQFIDRGERRVAIRPEMTPSVSRMIARKRQEIAYPARWFSIAQFMRYERPQRGREREFWQLNADIFGADTVASDAEAIALGHDLLKAFGADESMYTIRINNRKIIDYMMGTYLGLDTVQSHMMIKLFDRKDKMKPEDFRDQAIDIFGMPAAATGLKKLAGLLGSSSLSSLPEEIQSSEAFAQTRQLFHTLQEVGVRNIVFDITLMRGFDYYTGVVFEFFDTHPDNNRALFGGGRYDGLVGLFGAEPLSAVGFAPGLTMTELFLKTHNLVPKRTGGTDLYVISITQDAAGVMNLAKAMRVEGLKVEIDTTGRKIDKQLKTALKKNIPHILFVGDEELKKEVYNLKTVATGEERTLSIERIITAIEDYRRASRASDDDSDFELTI